jgi:hypothetical protein
VARIRYEGNLFDADLLEDIEDFAGPYARRLFLHLLET